MMEDAVMRECSWRIVPGVVCVVIAALLAGCSGDMQPTERGAPPPGDARIRGVKRLGSGIIIAIPGLELTGDAKLPLPNAADRALAKQLDRRIRDLGLKHLKQHRPHQKAFSLSAARRIGDFILLCYTWEEGADGDAFLVYSVKAGRIAGPFCWYIQG